MRDLLREGSRSVYVDGTTAMRGSGVGIYDGILSANK